MSVPPLIKTAALLIILAFLGLALSGCLASEGPDDFVVSRYEMLVELNADGSAMVTETLHYRMIRRSSEFFFEIEPGEGNDVRALQVDVAALIEGQNNVLDKYIVVSPAKSEFPETSAPYYWVDSTGPSTRVKVKIISEAGTNRTIRLSYQLDRAVVLGTDTAYLMRGFFNNHHEASVEEAILTLKLPVSLPDIRLWTMPVSLAEFVQSRPANDLITFTSQNIDGSSAAMMLYCLMPADEFAAAEPGAIVRDWDGLIAEARLKDSMLDEAQSGRRTIFGLIFVLLFGSVILVGLIYWLFDRESAASFRHRYWHGLPGCPPAVLSVLMKTDSPGRLILSTLLDLVRRDKLVLNGNVFMLAKPRDRDYSDYLAYEIFLVQWLFDHIAGDFVLSVAEIRRYAREKSKSGAMQAYYRQFRILLDEEIERRNLLDKRTMRRGRLISLLSAGCYLGLSISALLLLSETAGLVLLLPAAGLAFYASILRRLTPAGRELMAVGQAVRRTVQGRKDRKFITEPDYFCRILPAAIALKTSAQLTERLIKEGGATDAPFTEFDLAAYGIAPSAASWQEQVRRLSEDLRVMESMLSASLLLSTGIGH